MTEEPTKILLVDDRPENLQALEQLLDEPGLETVKASSGNEALAQLLAGDFACVLLDVNMPGMDGFETARFIRQDDCLAHIPIIFVTATSVATAEVFRGYASGAVDYLLKPLDPHVVRSKVSVFVRLHRQRQVIAHQARLLEASNADLSRVNAELERFAAVAAHDLKNPLSTMLLYTEALLKEPGMSRAQRVSFLTKIRSHARRAVQLIDDLLAYSSCAEPSGPLELVDCRQAVEAALENLHGLVRSAGARVEVEDLPVVAGDPQALMRLFQNLIGNAIQHRVPGRAPVVQVGSGRRGAESCLWVRDNGAGVEPEHADVIFEPFWRASGGQRYAGTGIGLAICQRIVEHHGGRIWVESAPGQGATFFFTLPGRERQAPAPAEPRAGDPDAGSASVAPGRGNEPRHST